MRYDWASFTTDYGTDDGFVAACRGVLARIAPDLRVLDVTHAIGPQDVRRGATVLADTVGYLPPSVHLAVVDPGVGTARRGVVLIAGESLLVGPDNGLLPPAAAALGGIAGAFELTRPRYRLPAVSATFHGRDVFAPAVAHLALGVPPAEFGPPVDPAALVRLPEPRVAAAPGALTADVLGADRFGNVQLAATAADLAALGAPPEGRVRLRHNGSTVDARVGRTFADVPPGALLVLVDSSGRVAIAVNGGSAARALGGATGEVTITA